MRVLLALGGNAMTNADGRARPEDQIEAAGVAMAAVAGLLEHDHDVVVTHGNGPQVGNLLVKNELAAGVVPPVPLDWCGAQTQATLGFVLMDALDTELAARSVDRRCAVLVTRTLVDADDEGFTHPTKPIGRHLPEAEASNVQWPDGEQWSVGVEGDYEAFGFGVTYTRLTSDTTDLGDLDVDNLLLGASFGWDAFAVGVVYSKILNADGPLDGADSYELSGEYDLGGGASVNAGVRRTYNTLTLGGDDQESAWIGDFGIRMSF